MVTRSLTRPLTHSLTHSVMLRFGRDRRCRCGVKVVPIIAKHTLALAKRSTFAIKSNLNPAYFHQAVILPCPACLPPLPALVDRANQQPHWSCSWIPIKFSRKFLQAVDGRSSIVSAMSLPPVCADLSAPLSLHSQFVRSPSKARACRCSLAQILPPERKAQS